MKRSPLYIALVFTLLFYSCNEPVPTELQMEEISSETQVDIEILSPEPDFYVYENGYDSIGYVEPLPSNLSIINLSGITTSYKNSNVRRTSAFALFRDKNRKITAPNGRTIGYYARLLGKVTLNDDEASVLPRIVRYKWHENVIDTSLGWVHYFYQRQGESSLFPFPFNSNVRFNLEPIIGNNIEFIIQTPEEIRGEVKVNGSKSKGNLRIFLKWNTKESGNIILVLGGMNKGDSSPFPLYKIRVNDNGHVEIPRSLLKTFPYDRYSRIMISFVRQKSTKIQNLEENQVLAQSIHNIIIDVP